MLRSEANILLLSDLLVVVPLESTNSHAQQGKECVQ